MSIFASAFVENAYWNDLHMYCIINFLIRWGGKFMGKLQKLIDNKAQSAKFMCDEIAHICNDMPKRDPGSEGEKMACEYMADYLKHDCGCERSTSQNTS